MDGSGDTLREGGGNLAIARLSDFLMGMAGIGLFLMMLHVVVDVIFRAFLHVALPGTIEVVSYYYMVIAVLLPLPMVQRHYAHIRVTLFTEWLSPRAAARMDGLVFAVFAVAAIGVAVITAGVALEKTHIGEAIVTPDGHVLIWPSRWILPASFLALSVVLVYQAVRGVRALEDTGDGIETAEGPAAGGSGADLSGKEKS